jgi:hypothetical protein
METYCSTGQSPQRAVAPTEEDEEGVEEEEEEKEEEAARLILVQTCYHRTDT